MKFNKSERSRVIIDNGSQRIVIEGDAGWSPGDEFFRSTGNGRRASNDDPSAPSGVRSMFRTPDLSHWDNGASRVAAKVVWFLFQVAWRVVKFTAWITMCFILGMMWSLLSRKS